jgi:hypothetical protein
VIRRLVAGLIVVGLAVGIWALWPRAGSDPTSTTLPVAAETTTTTIPGTTSTTVGASTTTDGSHVVTTVEEAEEILRALWFGWFEGIYNRDEDRIREVVGTQGMLDAALAQFGVMDFSIAPQPELISVSGVELLRTDEDCLAVWAETSATFRPGASQGVHVLRRASDRWIFAGSWIHRNDLWEADCESELEPLSS